MEKISKTLLVITYTQLPLPPNILDQLVKAYVEVFNSHDDDQEWGENWTYQTAQEKIFKDLSSGKPIISLLFSQEQERVVGFATAIVLSPQQIKEYLLPPNINRQDCSLALNKLQELKDKEVLFFLEFGIIKAFRGGGKKVLALLVSVLREAARYGTKHFVFWTMTKSKIYFLARAMLIFPIFHFSERNLVILRGKIRRTRFLAALGPKLASWFAYVSLAFQRLLKIQGRK